MLDTAEIDARIDRIARFPFRAQFHLRPQELNYLAQRGPEAMRTHAREFVTTRLAPAKPHKDGAQTPWGGHPVFRAQHATGTCCRGCLAKNHRIPPGRPLTEAEIDDVVAIICRWIERDLARYRARHGESAARPEPTLFDETP